MSCLVRVVTDGVWSEIERRGLEPEEFAVLQFFWEHDEWNATQLMQQLLLDPSRMSRLVAILVDRRLLRRRRARDDRRVVHLTLTGRGQELMDDLRQRFQAYEATLLQGVSDRQLDGFQSTTDKIMCNYMELELPTSQEHHSPTHQQNRQMVLFSRVIRMTCNLATIREADDTCHDPR